MPIRREIEENPNRSSGNQSDQETAGEPGQDHAETGPDQRQQQTLGKQLTDDPGSAGAYRKTDGRLSLP
jgi:hypothetical protein